jgi:hypothetical protein
MSKLFRPVQLASAIGLFTFLLAFPLFGQSQGTCTFTLYDPPSGFIYGLSPGGINHWNTVVGGASGPTQQMSKGYIRWANGEFTLFAVPNNAVTTFTDRNLNGTTVGLYAASITAPSNGLIYTSKSWATLNYPGSPSTSLTGINKWTTIIGNAVDPKTGNSFGFKYQHGGFGKIQYPKATQTIVDGINDNGVIVGAYKMTGDTNWSSFELQNGTFKKLNYTFPVVGINNSGVIVDSSNVHFPDGRTTFVYVGGSVETAVTGINDAGIITGFAYWGTFEYKGFTATCN